MKPRIKDSRQDIEDAVRRFREQEPRGYDGAPFFGDDEPREPMPAFDAHNPLPHFMRCKYFSGAVPFIKCAVCQSPVKKIVSELVDPDPLTLSSRRVLRVAFHCHGNVERVELDYQTMLETRDLQIGAAFQDEASRMLPSG